MKINFILLLFVFTAYLALGQVNPDARDHVFFTYFPYKNQIILYGGSGVDKGKYTWNADTWSWSNGTWKDENNGIPGKITSMSSVSVPHNQTLLMVGGINPEKGDLNETWILENDVWKLFEGNSPTARLSPAMAYDPVNKIVVLFSGCAGNKYPSDTWEWNGNDWIQKSSVGPEGLCRASLFYDLNRKKILLFGGVNDKGIKTNEMWEWDGLAWNKVNQGNEIPEPRSNFLIAFDENRKRAVLFGGSGNSGILDDLWEWDGNLWNKVETQGEKPSKREVYGITYHKQLKKIFIYGGRSGFAKPFGDLWSWDGEKWEIHK
jgi:hypothetical protein